MLNVVALRVFGSPDWISGGSADILSLYFGARKNETASAT